jgi:hypothetical protein
VVEIFEIAEQFGINAPFAAFLYFAWRFDKRLAKIEHKIF